MHKVYKLFTLNRGQVAANQKTEDQTESEVITDAQALNGGAWQVRQKEQHAAEAARQSSVHHRLSASLYLTACKRSLLRFS